ncbi:MAG: TRAM domain-containing protein, partial [Oscillospiraceae bacterium]|nr:TRAM domain-containing protein [Oscillospiraceae bacterium]
NRKYTTKQYVKIIDYAREKMPNISFTSDIIVGFPGETYEDFKLTLELVKKVKYSSLFMFIYSPRKGTKAELMNDFISKEEKSKWLMELIECQNDISEQVHNEYVGNVEKVFFDDISKTNDSMLSGWTDSHLVVECKCDKIKVGEFANVLITKAHRMALIGELTTK